MKFNKKGAMELGISTVVMLVIAIVIIGAGIAFIRGFFGTGTDTLIGAFEVADFGLEPTASKPLVLTDGQVSIKRGKEATVRVGFYNRDNSAHDVTIEFDKCVSSVTNDACGDEPVPRIIALEQELDPGESGGFATQVTASCQKVGDDEAVISGEFVPMLPGTYTCNLKAVNGTVELAKNQIVLTVTS